ncbi:MAG: sulfur carrier protein ThiS [Thermomicrobiales bacterium]
MTRVPRLLLVTDPARATLPLPELAAAAVEGGVDAIYLRHVAGEEIAPVVAEVRAVARPGVLLLVAGEPPTGVESVGRHLREKEPLGGDEPSPPAPLPMRGRGENAYGYPVSRSVHSPEEAARSLGVDFLVAGHVFPSASKPGRPPLGLERFAQIVAAAPCPVLAIGGITPDRVAAVMAAGAHGVAVIGAIGEAADPRAAAREMRRAIEAALIVHTGDVMTTESPAMTAITVNGKPREVPAGSTVRDLLASRKLADSMAIVERNGVILARESYASTTLEAGDQLEVVHAVGGG